MKNMNRWFWIVAWALAAFWVVDMLATALAQESYIPVLNPIHTQAGRALQPGLVSTGNVDATTSTVTAATVLAGTANAQTVNVTGSIRGTNYLGEGGVGTIPFGTGLATVYLNIASASAAVYCDTGQSFLTLYADTPFILLQTKPGSLTSKYTQITRTGINALTNAGAIKSRLIQYNPENGSLGFNTTTNSAIFMYAIMPATPTNGFQLVGGSTSSHYPLLIQSATGENRVYLQGHGALWTSGSMSALSYIDRTPGAEENALEELRTWKVKGKTIDHDSLGKSKLTREVTEVFLDLREKGKTIATITASEYVLDPTKYAKSEKIQRVEKRIEEGRDLSKFASDTAGAVQELDAIVAALEKRIEALEGRR